MITYADWAITKKWETIEVPSDEEVWYLEEGCPLYALVKLLDTGARVFKIPGTETAKLRKEKGLEKTNENDVILIKELAETRPELFVELLEKDKDELRRKFIVGKYRELTKIIVGFKNRQHAIEREYGPSDGFKKAIKDLENDKATEIKNVIPYIQQEMDVLSDIPGLGSAYIAQISVIAHPNKFKSKSAYLKYLGFINRNIIGNKYNRDAKSLYYNIMTQQMLMKTQYYDMLNKIKEKEKEKTCQNCYHTNLGHVCKRRKDMEQPICNGYAHSKAQNKIMTKLATIVYYKLHDIQTSGITWNVEKSLVEWFK